MGIEPKTPVFSPYESKCISFFPGDADREAGPGTFPEAPRGALLGPRLQRRRARALRRALEPWGSEL